MQKNSKGALNGVVVVAHFSRSALNCQEANRKVELNPGVSIQRNPQIIQKDSQTLDNIDSLQKMP